MLNLVLNGRFLTRALTGVDRVASELSRAVILELARGPARSRFRLSVPAAPITDVDLRPATLMALERAGSARQDGYLWEQFELPRRLGNDWLLSLCNVGPLLRKRQAIMIHDAQIYTQPASYSRAFRMTYRVFLPMLARRSQILLTVSEHSKRQLETLGVFPKGKAIVIPNGADHMHRIKSDTAILERHKLTANSYYLAIGSLAPHKNLSMLATVHKDITVPLVLAGGSNNKVFRDAGFATDEGVTMTGRVSDAEMKALYQNARALVFPSLAEGFGLPPIEAMACGCPVIATTAGAVPETCGDAALYADPQKPQDWATAMTHLATDDGLRADLIKKGHARASQFTWERAAKRLIEALSE